ERRLGDLGGRARADGRGAAARARAVRDPARARGSLPRSARAAAARGVGSTEPQCSRGSRRRGERRPVAPPRRATARTAALPARRPPSTLRRHLPSARSIAVGLALLGVAVGAYAIARETSVFAVRDVEVRGGTAALRAEVARALRPELGRSLVRVGGSDVE